MKTFLNSCSRLTVLVLSAAVVAACSSGPLQYGDEEGRFLNLPSLIQKNVYVAYAGDVQPLDKVGVVALDARLYVQGVKSEKGEEIKPQVFSVGPSLLKSSVLSQYHFLPGQYELAMCFYIDQGSGGSTRCRDTLPVSVNIQPGSKLQLSLDFKRWNVWTVLRQPPSDAARARLAKDFDTVMAANKR